jgi:transposase
LRKVQQLLKIVSGFLVQDHYGYDTDLWTIRRIIEVAKKHLKITIFKTAMHSILHAENLSYKKPEKRYYEENKEEQKTWISKTIHNIKKCIKKYNAILKMNQLFFLML